MIICSGCGQKYITKPGFCAQCREAMRNVKYIAARDTAKAAHPTLPTRNGYEARIYATDGGGATPIHGAVKGDDRWWARQWAADGTCVDRADAAYDLVMEGGK